MIRTHKTLKKALMNMKEYERMKIEKILKGIYKYYLLMNAFSG